MAKVPPKSPGNKARTERPQLPYAKPGGPVRDIKKEYTPRQLAEIGAIAPAWNIVEQMVDWLLFIALEIPLPSWLERQTMRLSLPPLPEFPDEPSIPR